MLNLGGSYPNLTVGSNGAILSVDGTLVHLIEANRLITEARHRYYRIPEQNKTSALLQKNKELQIMLSEAHMEAYNLSRKLNDATSENRLLKEELTRKVEVLMEIYNAKPFSNFIGVGLTFVVVGFISMLLSPVIGIIMFLMGFGALFFGSYGLWRTKNITIMNPNTALLGMLGSVLLIITALIGFVIY